MSELRMFAIVPAAKVASVNTWLHSNINAGGGDNFTIALNATGSVADPITYYCAAFTFTLPQAAKVLRKFCQMANVTPPDWESLTRQQRIDWVNSTIATVEANTGMIIYADDIDATWTDIPTALTSNNLKQAV